MATKKNNEDYDKWAQQMGAKNWQDLIEKYKENPEWFTYNKYKIQGDYSYTPDMIINRLERELSTQPGAKSAGGGQYTPISTPDSEPGTTPRKLTFPILAAQLGIDPNNPTKEGQEKLRSWIEEHANSYTPGEKTNAYLNAKNEADITKEVPGSTSAGDGNDDGGTAEDNYKKSMMSIWDAYRKGEISKETAGYFTIDAIATLAKNLGRSIGNVGAQFSGGTIDNGHDESKWGQRQNALLNEEIGKETESLGGAAGRQAESETLDNEAKKIINAYTPDQLERQIEMFKKDLEMADIDLDMAHSRTDLINFIKKNPDYAKSPFKMGLVAYLTQAGAAGAANNASKTLGDAINWMLTLFKWR